MKKNKWEVLKHLDFSHRIFVKIYSLWNISICFCSFLSYSFIFTVSLCYFLLSNLFLLAHCYDKSFQLSILKHHSICLDIRSFCCLMPLQPALWFSKNEKTSKPKTRAQISKIFQRHLEDGAVWRHRAHALENRCVFL